MTVEIVPRVAAFIAAAPEVDATARAAIQRRVTSLDATPGLVLLATCHRVEVLVDADAVPDPLGTAGLRRLDGVEAARHVIALAVGLESAVVGEDQVLHQLRAAVTAARARSPLGADLGPLLDAALRAGRRGRSWRPADGGRPHRSLADLAVARVAHVLETRDGGDGGGLRGRTVLVAGTGEMGRGAIAALRARGARVLVASRTDARALVVAADTGVDAVVGDPHRAIEAADAVIVALAGPWSLPAAAASALASRGIVVDLSMPSAVPSDVATRLGDRAIDIDGLAVDAPADGTQARYHERLADLVDRTLEAYLADLAARRTSAADRLAARVERQRTAGLAAYLRQRPDLDPEVRDELDELTRDLSARLFREPLARLARDPDGRRRRALDELFGA